MSQTIHREEQLGNFQKELLTNYFLQKYNNIMTEMSHDSQENHLPKFDSKPKYSSRKKVNFKSLMKNKGRNNSASKIKIEVSPYQEESIVQDNKMLMSPYEQKQQQSEKSNLKKLQNSLVRELFKETPTKLDHNVYKKVEISPYGGSKRSPSPNKQSLFIESENIQVTYEDKNQQLGSEQDFWNEEESSDVVNIREAIRQQFQERKSPKYIQKSRQSSRQKRSNGINSSRISSQGKVDEPKQSKRVSPFKKQILNKKSINEEYQPSKKTSRRESISPRKDSVNMKNSPYILDSKEHPTSPKVHFSNETVQPINNSTSKVYSEPSEDIVENDIEFVAPSSSYYKSQNANFIEQAFQNQNMVQTSSFISEREKAFSEDKNVVIGKAIRGQSSKKNSKEKPHSNSSGKNSSTSKSFISKVSMFSPEQALNLKNSIEKELFDNELGPYQSGLYSVLELLEKYPRSSSVLTVGKRTLDDRREVELKKATQLTQMEGYKKSIDRIQRRSAYQHLGSQEVVKKNQMEIMKLIRKLGNKLK